MRFVAGLPLLLPFVIGCGLVLDLDPPPDGALPDGALPDGAVPDALLVDGQTPDAGDDAPIFDGGTCITSDDCDSTPECITECDSGRCMQRLNDDGVCECQEGAEITRPLRDGCGSVLRTCTGGVFTDAAFPAEEGCDGTCVRGPTLYPEASCGVGACRGSSSGCAPTCFVGMPAPTDGCTPAGVDPVDDDCDGRIDEDCLGPIDNCDHVFDADTPEVEIGEGINCFLAPGDGPCSPITFQSASGLPEGDATLIGNLYIDSDETIRRCASVAGGRFSSTALNIRDGWQVQPGTEIRIQDMIVTTDTVPAIESTDASLHLHGVVMSGALRTSGGQLEITGSRVTSSAGRTIETSDTIVDIAGSCDNRPSGRCALPVVGNVAFLGIFNTGTGTALRAQGGTLRMDGSYMSAASGRSMQLDAMNTFTINGSAILADTGNGSGDPVNIDVNGCSTRSSIRESIVVATASLTRGGRFVAVRNVDCSLLLSGDGDEELSGPNPRIVGLSSGSGQNAVGLECEGSGGCTVRDIPIAGFAGTATPSGADSSGVGVRCETFCSLTNVAAAGNVSDGRSVAATGAALSGTAIIHRSTLVGGNSPVATGLSGDQITIQDSLAVGYGRRVLRVEGTGKGIGVNASGLNALQCTFAGRAQVADAASVSLPATCDGAALFGEPSVLVSTINAAGLCDNPIGVYVETGDPMPTMSHVAFGPSDGYVGSDGLDVEPLDSPPFHSNVIRFSADAFTSPGPLEVGYRPRGSSVLAGGGNPDSATPFDRRGTPRPVPPAIGALEPTP